MAGDIEVYTGGIEIIYYSLRAVSGVYSHPNITFEYYFNGVTNLKHKIVDQGRGGGGGYNRHH